MSLNTHPVHMPALGRCWQHRPSTGMFTGPIHPFCETVHSLGPLYQTYQAHPHAPYQNSQILFDSSSHFTIFISFKLLQAVLLFPLLQRQILTSYIILKYLLVEHTDQPNMFDNRGPQSHIHYGNPPVEYNIQNISHLRYIIHCMKFCIRMKNKILFLSQYLFSSRAHPL